MSFKNRVTKALEVSSIKYILALAVSFFVLIPCCIFLIFLFKSMYSATAKEFMNSQQNILHQTTYILENMINTLNSSSTYIYLSSDLKKDMKIAQESTGTAEKFRALERIRGYINNMSSTLYTINGKIAIVTLDGIITDEGYTSALEKSLQDFDWYKKVVNNRGLPYWDRDISEIYRDLKVTDSGIACARMLYSQSNEPLGIVAIMVPDTSFWTKLKSIDLSYRGSMYVLAQGGNIIASDFGSSFSNFNNALPFDIDLSQYDRYNTAQKIDLDKDRQLLILPIGKTDFYLINEISEKIMLSNLSKNITKMILLIVLVFIIFYVAVYVISQKISEPIVKLTDTINQVAQGNLTQRAEVYGYKEIYRLSDSFNRMTEEMEQLIKDIEIQVALKEEAHFDMLRAQINPHFLFNTLNSIKWIACINGVDTISDAISELGKILDATLNHNDRMIPLSNELEILNAYINIQKLRYGNTFEFRNNISEDLTGYYVPKFILQPIVENSIFHGISDTSNGLIAVSGELEDSDLLIVVKDNGKGVSKEMLDKLLVSEKQSNHYMTGIGIKNIHERLKLQFGPKYGLTIISGESKGFSVTLRIPSMLVQNFKNGEEGFEGTDC